MTTHPILLQTGTDKVKIENELLHNLLSELRTWVGDGENSKDHGLPREHWSEFFTPQYIDILSRVDDALSKTTEAVPVLTRDQLLTIQTFLNRIEGTGWGGASEYDTIKGYVDFALEGTPRIDLWTLRDLRLANEARQAEWCANGDTPDLAFRGNELAGETGEACNVIKKLERERHGWAGSRATQDDLAQELADVVICADLVACAAGIDLMEAVRMKFNATSRKVGMKTMLGNNGDEA